MTRFTIFRIQAVIGTAYVVAGAAKLAGAPLMVEAFDMIGLGQTARVAVGAVEVMGGLCLFMPVASIYAAMVLGCTVLAMLGATVGHAARFGVDQPQLDLPQLAVAKLSHAQAAREGVVFPGGSHPRGNEQLRI